jgi:hypothetical protein
VAATLLDLVHGPMTDLAQSLSTKSLLLV